MNYTVLFFGLLIVFVFTEIVKAVHLGFIASRIENVEYQMYNRLKYEKERDGDVRKD